MSLFQIGPAPDFTFVPVVDNAGVTIGIEQLLRFPSGRPRVAAFNVVVVYDDSTAGRRGMKMFSGLQASASRGIGFHCDL
jgi:hypothetical protein